MYRNDLNVTNSKRIPGGLLMITCDDINLFFETYRKNRKECFRWDDRIFCSNTKEIWLSTMKKRAFAVHKIYIQNDSLLDRSLLPLLSAPSELNEEQADCLLNWLKRFYYGKDDEPFLIHSLAELLLPFYEKRNDTENLIFLYTCGGYSCLEISHMFDRSVGKKSVEYYKKVISYQDSLDTIQNPLNKICIFVAYANLICVEPILQNISLEEAYFLWQQLYLLYFSLKENHQIWSEKRIPHLIRATLESFLSSGLFLDLEHLFEDSPIRPLIDEIAYTRFFTLLQNAKNPMDVDVDYVMDYYLILAKKGLTTWDKCWQSMDELYLHQLKHVRQKADANLTGFYFVFPIILIETIEKTTLPEDLRDLKKHFYLNVSRKFLKNYPAGFRSYEMNYAIQRFAFHPAVLNCFPTRKEKELFLFDVILSRHLMTFTHSVMVAKLAEAILPYIFQYAPELFLTQNGYYNSVQEVLAHREQICDYIHSAALLHDVGKNAMVDIINTQHRKITNHEFSIIQMHPQKGFEYLSSVPDFDIYKDVAIGHHRSYDGRMGYPMSFDNRNSAYAPAIDLIRICDCLDAATDNLTRYYHIPKSFDEVMQEFIQGKGTQYHPGMIDLIWEHNSLYEELRWLATEGRSNTYYEIYQRFIRKNESEHTNLL